MEQQLKEAEFRLETMETHQQSIYSDLEGIKGSLAKLDKQMSLVLKSVLEARPPDTADDFPAVTPTPRGSILGAPPASDSSALFAPRHGAMTSSQLRYFKSPKLDFPTIQW